MICIKKGVFYMYRRNVYIKTRNAMRFFAVRVSNYLQSIDAKTAENLIPAATGFPQSVSFFVRGANIPILSNSLQIGKKKTAHISQHWPSSKIKIQ